jgi:hypothetical protein
VTHDIPAGVHDECLRSQQRFDILEPQKSLVAIRNQARRGRIQMDRALSTSAVSAGMRASRAARSARASAARAVSVRRRRIAIPASTSSWTVLDAEGRASGSSLGERALGFVHAPDKQKSPHLEISRVRGVHMIAMRFERCPRRIERLRGPAEVTRGERDLRFRDDTTRTSHGLLRPEGTRGTSQQRLRSSEIAKLRHRNASKRERRCIFAQRDPLQCAERIARRQRARRGRYQRVHRNPVTLVTPTSRVHRLIYLTAGDHPGCLYQEI